MLAVVGVGGYLFYKHYIAAKTPVAGAAGYGYGASSYGMAAYGSQYGYAAFGYGYVPAGYPGGGGGYPWWSGYGYGQRPPTGPQPITTNAQWFQAAIADLGSTGADKIGVALAAYIAGLPVGQSSQQIIMEAQAFEGPPPVPGLNGYPPKVHLLQDHHKGGNGQGGNKGGTTSIRINHSGRLDQIAHWRGWSKSFEAEVERLNGLNGNSMVRKGQRLTVPKH